MGTLIPMPRAKSVQTRVQPSSAEILFFTGVRYYRMTEDGAASPIASAVRTKRGSAPLRRRRSGRAVPNTLEATV